MTISIHRNIGLDILEMNYLPFSGSTSFTQANQFVDMPDGSKIWFTINNSEKSVYYFVKVLSNGKRQYLVVNTDQLDSTTCLKFLFFPLYLLQRRLGNMIEKVDKQNQASIELIKKRAKKIEENNKILDKMDENLNRFKKLSVQFKEQLEKDKRMSDITKKQLNEASSFCYKIEEQLDETRRLLDERMQRADERMKQLNEFKKRLDEVKAQSSTQLFIQEQLPTSALPSAFSLNNTPSPAKSIFSRAYQLTIQQLFPSPAQTDLNPSKEGEEKTVNESCSSFSLSGSVFSHPSQQIEPGSLEKERPFQEKEGISLWKRIREKCSFSFLFLAVYLKTLWQCIFCFKANNASI